MSEENPDDQTPEGGEGGSAIGNDSTPLNELIPEKYRVFEGEGDDAKFDIDASARKLADGFSSLEKKLGTGDLPPDSPEGYEINTENLGEEFNAEEFMKDESTQGFLKRMHAKGMTNAQVQEVIEYGLTEWAPQLVGGNEELSQEQCIKTLQEDVWKDPDEFKQNMSAANRLYRSLPEDLQQEVDSRIGNDPTFLKIAAMFGKEMSEDAPAGEAEGQGEDSTIEKLMLSDAYRDPKHPDHKAASAKVKAYFEKKNPGKAA